MNKKVDLDHETDREHPKPICLECSHYYITWDTQFPYGCRSMDFKSKRSPHLDVLESSGSPCMMFTPRRLRDRSTGGRDE